MDGYLLEGIFETTQRIPIKFGTDKKHSLVEP